MGWNKGSDDELIRDISALEARLDSEYENTRNAINNANLNDYVQNGKYWFGTGATNAPTSSWFGMNVEHYLSGMTIQTVTAAAGGQWVRTFNGSSWTSWQKTTP